jgi:hypothetical protein
MSEDYSQWDRDWGETNADFADRKRREHALREKLGPDHGEPRRRKGRCGPSQRMTDNEITTLRVKNGSATRAAHDVGNVLRQLLRASR